MSSSQIETTLPSEEISPQQLGEIRNYTRRELSPEDLYVFSLLLCDNEIDRDGEQFSVESLHQLAPLYCGKTGVLDHQAKAENQSARIFQTEVVEMGSYNSLGEPYYALKAWAYMVRCDKNKDFILEIDAGIKKEVSVGCAVEEVLCSICGQNQKEGSCAHQKGEIYGSTLCYHVLSRPTDAYEWSFVAVPAQKNAGVTKHYDRQASTLPMLLEKIQKAQQDTSLTKGELALLKAHMEQLQKLSHAGKIWREELKKDIIRKASKVQPSLDSALLEEVCYGLTLEQLQVLHKNFEEMEEACYQPTLQLSPLEEQSQPQTQFKI